MAISVAIEGAPCAGKTTVLNLLRENSGFHKLDKPRIILLKDAWENFGDFAEVLIEIFNEDGGFNERNIGEIKDWMDNFDLGSIKSTVVSNPDRVFKTEVVDGTTWYWEYVNIRDIYDIIGCNFLETIASAHTEEELRKILQANLLLVQARNERRLGVSLLHPFPPNILVCDGSIPGITEYWPGMTIEDYKELSGFWMLEMLEENQVLFRGYEVFILLETLANLPEGEYEEFFYDGRRLDTPEDAQDLHQRLIEKTNDHPCRFILPAALSIEVKTEIILSIVMQLRESIIQNPNTFRVDTEDLKARVRKTLKGKNISTDFLKTS